MPVDELVPDIEAVPDSAEEGPPTSEVELDVIPGGAEDDTDESELPDNR